MKKTTETVKSISEGQPMRVDFIDDAFADKNIKVLGMLPVTNPIPTERGALPTPDGIYSPIIFGATQDEKKKKCGYIDLHCKVFHPYAFEIITRMDKRIKSIALGVGCWKVDENGTLVEIGETEEGYDHTQTGITWLVNNFKKIKFEATDSKIRDSRMQLIDSMDENELFISKWIVIPVFYREMQEINGIMNPPIIAEYYNKLISLSNHVSDSEWNGDSSSANTKWSIQKTLVDIRKLGQSLIEKKHGFFKKSVIGKSTDYGVRSVISVPNLEFFDKPSDCQVDIYHTGIPLSQCCVLGFPFVLRAAQEMFRKIFDSYGSRLPVMRDPETGKTEYIEVKDPMSKFTSEYIKKNIDLYIHTPGVRFRPITIDTEEGEKSIFFTGVPFSNKPKESTVSDIGMRPLTWTDVLYMAAEDALNDKHLYITRYPLVDYFGIFPSKVTVLSTAKTAPMTVNGNFYKYYPVIDSSLPESVVSTLFVDTTTMDNTYLKGLGGDYDGDVVTDKMVFSQEANQEANTLMMSPKNYVNIAGEFMRTVGNETFLTFYNMTK